MRGETDVPHPFLIWTKEEAAAIKKRIETDETAKKQYERMVARDGGLDDRGLAVVEHDAVEVVAVGKQLAPRLRGELAAGGDVAPGRGLASGLLAQPDGVARAARDEA
jgi:hypothetical protein